MDASHDHPSFAKFISNPHLRTAVGVALVLALGVLVFYVAAPDDSEAVAMIERLGGDWTGRFFFGRPIIETADFRFCAPTAKDLELLRDCLHLRRIDLGYADVSDRALLALVGIGAHQIIIPSRTSEDVKSQFPAWQVSTAFPLAPNCRLEPGAIGLRPREVDIAG